MRTLLVRLLVCVSCLGEGQGLLGAEGAATGLYYNRFRYYDPQAGQYLSQDPIGLEGGLGLHNYVHDPNSWVDFFGLQQTCQVTQQLQAHANTAKAMARLTKSQRQSIMRSINRARNAEKVGDFAGKAFHTNKAFTKRKMYMGDRIDKEFKNLVKNDPSLQNIVKVTDRGKFGPDVFDPKNKQYWDLTTKKDWARGTHQAKYDKIFGQGTGVFY